MNRPTFGDLKKFLEQNKDIEDDSIIAIIDDENKTLKFVKSISFLDMTGAFSWVQENGEALPRERGSAIALLTQGGGKYEEGATEDKIRSTESLTKGTNVIYYSSNGDLGDLIHSIDKNLEGNGGSKDSLLIGWEGDLVNEITKLHDITVYTSDNYGHDVVFSPESPILALISREKVKQQISENYQMRYIKKRS